MTDCEIGCGRVGFRLPRSAGSKIFLIRPDCSLEEGEQLDAVPEASQFANHFARPHFLGFEADRWPAFFIADALVEQLRIPSPT